VVIVVEQVLLLYHVVEPDFLYNVVAVPLPPFCVAFIVIALHVAVHVPAIVVPLFVHPVLQLYRA